MRYNRNLRQPDSQNYIFFNDRVEAQIYTYGCDIKKHYFLNIFPNIKENTFP